MTKNAATHKGTCQLCGAMQMLPNGVLAKHGYTTKWGFFSGTCAGSGYLPFEQSTDQIAAGIASVRSQVESLQAEIAKIEDLNSATNDGTCVKTHLYVGSGYRWVDVKLHDFTPRIVRTVANDGYDFVTYRCSFTTLRAERTKGTYNSTLEPVTEEINAYTASSELDSVRKWAQWLNRKYAAHLQKEIDQRKSWVAWQKTRCDKWAPAPLTPR